MSASQAVGQNSSVSCRQPAGVYQKVACVSCSLHEVCLPRGLSPDEVAQLDLIYTRRTIARGQHLYRQGDPFSSIYAVRSGYLKTTVLHDDGRDQVTGFLMAGEVTGFDGICTNQYTQSAVALEDSEVCVIQFAKLEELSLGIRPLHHQVIQMLSREIVRDRVVMLMLGSLTAEERVAALLINLSHRLGARGTSPVEFSLKMSREEIGSYLGIKHETVSRAMSRLEELGMITVRKKKVKINDLPGLRRFMGRNI